MKNLEHYEKFKSDLRKEIKQLEEEIKFLENCPLLYSGNIEDEIQELISTYNEKIMFLKKHI